MNIVVTFFFFIFALNQVNAFDLTVHINRLQGNSFIPVTVNLLSSTNDTGFGSEPNLYEIIFNRDVDEEHDMPLEFTFYTDTYRPLNSKPGSIKFTSLCTPTEDTIEGHTTKLSARILGIENDPVCPIKKGARFIQNEFFTLDFDDYHMLLFNPDGPGYDAYLIVETEDHLLYHIFTTYDWNE